MLFFDPILSGNRNISCATCHHPDHGGGDGLSLGIGEGGAGVGPTRVAETPHSRIVKRIPRNAPALWDLGHREVRVIFHDGRLEASDLYGGRFRSPAEEWLPTGFDSILAAQAVFPLIARFEMAGDPGENEVAGALNDRIDAGWPVVAAQVRAVPGYLPLFAAAYPEVKTPGDIDVVRIANALGAFQATQWRSGPNRLDRFVAGDPTALGQRERWGMDLFFGRGGCSGCHSGPLFTDQKFHALGLPQFGPGRTRRFDPTPRDVGRMGVTDRLEDAYRFRTPSLRNVALTAPYGHNGAYPTLEGIIRHHIAPRRALARWTRDMAMLPDAPWLAGVDFAIAEDRFEVARHARSLDIAPTDLTENDVENLAAFLRALTEEAPASGRLGRPDAVPSGLPVD